MPDGGDGGYAATIVETITQPLLVLDGELRVHDANPAYLEQFRTTREDSMGRPVYDLGNGQWNIPELRRLLKQVLTENGQVQNYRVEHDFDRIGRRIMMVNANPMRPTDGPDLILLAISDVSERERLICELEGRKEFAEKLIDSVRESLLIMGGDLRVHSANTPFYDHFQTSPQETEGRLVYELGNGQWNIPKLRQLLEEVLPNENAFDDFEVEHEFERIGKRTMLLNARRLDHLNLIILAVQDVTERRQQEQRQQTFMRELHHRVNNILHNVRSLATQTRRGRKDLNDFFEAFEARLGALSRNQDLLLRSPSAAVPLHEIIQVELDAIGAEQGRDFNTNGPALDLSPDHAQAVGLMVHELTTNAAKYGALRERGRIEIVWRIDRRSDEQWVVFRWREHGVAVEDTRTKGFGSRAIEEALPQMLGGTTRLDFHPDGAECLAEFPLPAKTQRSSRR